jgi:hypothetical protein
VFGSGLESDEQRAGMLCAAVFGDGSPFGASAFLRVTSRAEPRTYLRGGAPASSSSRDDAIKGAANDVMRGDELMTRAMLWVKYGFCTCLGLLVIGLAAISGPPHSEAQAPPIDLGPEATRF